MAEVVGNFAILGDVPQAFIDDVAAAIRTLPETLFLGTPKPKPHPAFDKALASGLRAAGWTDAQEDFQPFADREFSVDISSRSRGVLIEIEKGTLPRVELDLLKLAGAARLPGSPWLWGLFVVPDTYIEMKLSQGNTPYQFLGRLKPIAAAALEGTLKGIAVIGYRDPR